MLFLTSVFTLFFVALTMFFIDIFAWVAPSHTPAPGSERPSLITHSQ